MTELNLDLQTVQSSRIQFLMNNNTNSSKLASSSALSSHMVLKNELQLS